MDSDTPGYLSTEPYFEHDGDQYCTLQRTYKGLPKITGLPVIKRERQRSFIKEKKTIHWSEGKVREKRRFPYLKKKKIEDDSAKRSLKVPIYQNVRAPKICSINRLVNWPFRKWGAYQAAITGTYGSGKSNLLNLLLAFHLAGKLRVLMFNDRRFEARNLADKGYFDKTGFHPFQIDVFIPKGYQFKNSNPLWEERKNVHLVEWTNIYDIINAMRPHHLTVVYTECFDRQSVIKLWMDLMGILAEEINPNKHYMFAHHEFSSLIPETPTKEMAKLVRDAADVALNLRKDRIGLLTTFHMLAEVFYRFSQKYTYLLQKRPVIRRMMTKPEYDARNFKLSQFNIVFGGRWMKHDIGMFPEVEDNYRLIPSNDKISYPSLNVITEDNEIQIEKITLDKIDHEILLLRLEDQSFDKISEVVGMPKSTVRDRLIKLKKNKRFSDSDRLMPIH